MYYAKVSGDSLLLYPYHWGVLEQENPFSRFDSRYNMVEWYTKTESARSSNSVLVPVRLAAVPELDVATHYAIPKDLPELINGEWVLGWDVLEKPVFVDEDEE